MFHYTDYHLVNWVWDFVAGDVFGIDPQEVDVIYIDGNVGENGPFVCIATPNQSISSGVPSRSKPLL